jgi:hypothetical protein
VRRTESEREDSESDRPSDLPPRSVVGVLKRTFRAFKADDLTDLAAALTYYGVACDLADPDRAGLDTRADREAMRTGRRVIVEIKAEYAQLVGAERVEAAAQTVDELIHGLDAPPAGVSLHARRP